MSSLWWSGDFAVVEFLINWRRRNLTNWVWSCWTLELTLRLYWKASYYWSAFHIPQLSIFITLHIRLVPSVLWRCWLGGRKGIRPVKTWVMRCWHGYRSGAMCKWLDGVADATATPSSLLQKIQNGWSFWYRPTQVVLEKKAVKRLCVCVCTCVNIG